MIQLVSHGLTDSEILEICGETAIKHVDKISKLRLAYLRDKYKSQRRLDLKVHYITGKTGTGKSRDILDEHGNENVYRVTDYQPPFDSYQCEPFSLRGISFQYTLAGHAKLPRCLPCGVACQILE